MYSMWYIVAHMASYKKKIKHAIYPEQYVHREKDDFKKNGHFS